MSLDLINEYAHLERQMIDSFKAGSKRQNVREGNFKKSFNYLLIDPRIAENFLADFQVCIEIETKVFRFINLYTKLISH